MRIRVLLILFSVVNVTQLHAQEVNPETATCPEHKVRFHAETRLPYKLVLSQQKSYYISVTYDLDGSGKAQNVQLKSIPQNTQFDNAYIAAVKKARITKGVIGTACSLESSFEISKATTSSVGGS